MQDETASLLGVEEVAELFHVARSTVTRWVQDGKLPAYSIGRRGTYAFDPGVIEAHLASAADWSAKS